MLETEKMLQFGTEKILNVRGTSFQRNSFRKMYRRKLVRAFLFNDVGNILPLLNLHFRFSDQGLYFRLCQLNYIAHFLRNNARLIFQFSLKFSRISTRVLHLRPLHIRTCTIRDAGGQMSKIAWTAIL